MDKIEKNTVKYLIPKRPENSNKGTFGRILTIAGSLNYQGAAYLSAVSALKSGAGLVSLATIETVINNISALTPNLTFLKLRDSYKQCIASDSFPEIKPFFDKYNVIAMGPGLSDNPAVFAFVNEALGFMKDIETPVVLDADALNAIADSKITKLPKNSIITPHPKEMSRLLDVSLEEILADRANAAKRAVEKFNCTAILKGSGTIVCTKDFRFFENTSGSSALAKAGSGDVLTGIISAFLAQGLSCENAAIAGVFLHGLCGEIAAESLTEYCVLAQDVIDAIPEAFKRILG